VNIRFVKVSDIIAELQTFDPNLPVVLNSCEEYTGDRFKEQLTYYDSNNPLEYQRIEFYTQEFANHMGQQGLGLFIRTE
jgi:small nuclear ribonucleoprotein (snRNP)-like protein